MISKKYAQKVCKQIDRCKTKPTSQYGIRYLDDDHGTSHLCVVDAQGNAVTLTFSINNYFGSFIPIPGTAMMLNNTMDDFAVTTNRPNAYSLLQSKSAIIEPGKRPLSSMTPTLVLHKRESAFTCGSIRRSTHYHGYLADHAERIR